jgi:hypothetical protein
MVSSGERTSEWISTSAPHKVAGLERQHNRVQMDLPAPRARIKLQDLSLDTIVLGLLLERVEKKT